MTARRLPMLGATLVSMALASGAAAQPRARAGCELRRDDYGFPAVRVTPEGGPPFTLAVEGHQVRVRYVGGRLAEARFRRVLEFAGAPSAIDLRARRDLSLPGGLGRLGAGFALVLVPAPAGGRGRDALQAIAHVRGRDLRLGPFPLACDALSLGAPPRQARRPSPAVPPEALLEGRGTRWIARTGSLELRERPGGGRRLTVQLAYGEMDPVVELDRRPGWLRVGRLLGPGSWFSGWVPEDALAPYEEVRGGLGALGMGGRGCGAGDAPEEGEVEVAAHVPAGTAVLAAAGRERWATVVADTDVRVRVRPGAEWARLVGLPGLTELARGTSCPQPLGRAFVRTDALAFRQPLPSPAIAAPAPAPAAGVGRIAEARARLGLDRRGTLAAGRDFACALRSGTPYCWGSNEYGQLGDGTATGRDSAAPVPGIDDAVQIAAGYGRACVVRRSGAVACWGDEHGVTAVAGLDDAVSIALGAAHACVSRRDGRVACWGSNEHGALGDGTDRDAPRPTEVAGLGDALAVVAGVRHACALRAGGTASCWGGASDGQAGDGGDAPLRRRPVAVRGVSGATALSAWGTTTCALGTSGAVSCWGGEREILRAVAQGRVPVRESARLPELDGVTGVAVGDDFACALGAGGRARCWGDDERGALGTAQRLGYALHEVDGLAGAVEIAAGGGIACAGDAGGHVRCWGPRTVHAPTPVVGVGPAAALALGYHHGCALERGGALRCWGDPSRSSPPSLEPGVQVGSLAASIGTTCLVGRDGRVRCSGDAPPITTEVRALALDVYGGCALLRSGDVRCWGREVADTTRIDTGDVEQVLAAAGGRCARTRGGRVLCWTTPEQADPTRPTAGTPTPIPGLDDAAQIALAGWIGCARHRGGGTSCWTRRTPAPVEVPELVDAAWIAGGDDRVCAVHRTGAVSCVTLAGSGLRVRAVPGVLQETRVEVGHDRACVLGREGRVRCWGRNLRGMVDGRAGAVEIAGLP